MKREDFYEQMTTPDAPDRMNFVLRRGENDDLTRLFSPDAFESVGYQMHDFFAARTVGYAKRNGHGPRSARVEMRVVWDEDMTDEQLAEGPPWYSVADDGLVPVDGSHRLAPFLADRHGGE